ncbi:MAG TPA: hypothetical protein PKH95_00380 [Candidatus Magasanikbacteria bacterium]|nr:hypothetical protein [Candidatus Magasanikbacteria bacterium]
MLNFVKKVFNNKEEVPENLENVANYAGFKLAFYLNACNLNEIEKEKVFKILRGKTYQEILEILDRFDALYAEGKTGEMNNQFEAEVKKISEKTNLEKKVLEEKSIAQMKELFTEVKAMAQNKR